MKDLIQDIYFSFRSFRRNAGFTFTIVVALAFGIGVTSAIFSAVNGVLLRPLAFPQPDRLVLLYESNLAKGWKQTTVSPPNFVDIAAQSQSVDRISAFRAAAFNFRADTEPERMLGARVSSDFFATLGVQPALGRTFTRDEDQPGRDQLVVLSYGFWQGHFRGDRQIIGTSMILNDRPYSIIGVMPETFHFPGKSQVWTPMAFSPADLANRGTHFLSVVARLKPGLTFAQTQDEFGKIAQHLQKEYPNPNAGMGISIVPLHEAMVGKVRLMLYLLMGAVLLLLLIACANVASLFIARIAARERELAVRAALGAALGRLVRQLLTESLLLGICGGAIGCLITLATVRVLPAISPKSIPRVNEISVDGHVVAFTLLVSLFTGVLFGMAPALVATRTALRDALAERSEAAGGRRWQNLRSILVVSEVALALMLLIGSGLLMRSMQRINSVDLGFRTEETLIMEISLPRARYPEGTQQAAFAQKTTERIASLPQVQAVAASSVFPTVGDDLNGFIIEGSEIKSQADIPSANYYAVTTDYFRTMAIPLIKGRYFEGRDKEGAPRVVIISNTLAKRYFPGIDPIGRHVHITNGQGTIYREIVGVVGDIRQNGAAAGISPQIYEPFSQAPRPYMTLIIHTSGSPSTLAKVVREQVYSVDSNQPMANVQTVETLLGEQIAPRRLSAALLTLFSATALLLAAIGTYGLLMLLVMRRRRELGIRLALGATRGELLRLIVQHGLRLVFFGVLFGLIGSMMLTRLFASLLFGVGTLDLITFVTATLILFCVAFVACYVPAFRASNLDPIIALQET